MHFAFPFSFCSLIFIYKNDYRWNSSSSRLQVISSNQIKHKIIFGFLVRREFWQVLVIDVYQSIFNQLSKALKRTYISHFEGRKSIISMMTDACSLLTNNGTTFDGNVIVYRALTLTDAWSKIAAKARGVRFKPPAIIVIFELG